VWQYPYPYASFASDLDDIEYIKVKFDEGEPLKQLDYLLAVLNSENKYLVPKAF
jgi:5'-3' exoribonuclease 2